MLQIKMQDSIPGLDTRKQVGLKDIVDFVGKQKWKWADHVARMNDSRW